MRILVTGGSGQLGKCLKNIANKQNTFKFVSKSELDITKLKEVSSCIAAYNPDIVFHFAAKTRGDDCARNPAAARLTNVTGTRNIVKACKRYKAALLFISTNEVFDGKKKTPYSERDMPHPISVVGRQKYIAEEIIRNNMSSYYIVRTMWLYSEFSSNFLQAIFKKAQKNTTLRIVDDEVGSPTSTTELAYALLKLVKTSKYGTYHLANQGAASRLDFAMVALKAAGLLDCKIIPVKLSEYKRISPPPQFSALTSVKAEGLGIVMKSWRTALISFVKNNKEYLFSQQ